MRYFVIGASGLCFFLAAYLPFATWETILWRGKVLGTRDALKKEYEDIFRLKNDDEVAIIRNKAFDANSAFTFN